jgi:hypothetical protein
VRTTAMALCGEIAGVVGRVEADDVLQLSHLIPKLGSFNFCSAFQVLSRTRNERAERDN